MTADEIIVDDAGGIVTVTINRPAMKNAISVTMFETMRDTFRSITARQEARCVVLTGTHDFAAGADLTRGGSRKRPQRAHTPYSMSGLLYTRVALHENPVSRSALMP